MNEQNLREALADKLFRGQETLSLSFCGSDDLFILNPTIHEQGLQFGYNNFSFRVVEALPDEYRETGYNPYLVHGKPFQIGIIFRTRKELQNMKSVDGILKRFFSVASQDRKKLQTAPRRMIPVLSDFDYLRQCFDYYYDIRFPVNTWEYDLPGSRFRMVRYIPEGSLFTFLVSIGCSFELASLLLNASHEQVVFGLHEMTVTKTPGAQALALSFQVPAHRLSDFFENEYFQLIMQEIAQQTLEENLS